MVLHTDILEYMVQSFKKYVTLFPLHRVDLKNKIQAMNPQGGKISSKLKTLLSEKYLFIELVFIKVLRNMISEWHKPVLQI